MITRRENFEVRNLTASELQAVAGGVDTIGETFSNRDSSGHDAGTASGTAASRDQTHSGYTCPNDHTLTIFDRME